jgi:hypothetical protein
MVRPVTIKSPQPGVGAPDDPLAACQGVFVAVGLGVSVAGIHRVVKVTTVVRPATTSADPRCVSLPRLARTACAGGTSQKTKFHPTFVGIDHRTGIGTRRDQCHRCKA